MSDAVLRIRATPRGGKTEISRVQDGVIHVRVAAPPVDGAANIAVLRLLSDALGVPKSRLSIRSGASGRDKQVVVSGMDTSDALDRLTAGRAG